MYTIIDLKDGGIAHMRANECHPPAFSEENGRPLLSDSNDCCKTLDKRKNRPP